MSVQHGVVAAGHQVTANAAMSILQQGGNAFDAALAALFASCIAEPVLASLGGGGFMLVRPAGDTPMLYDFFTQTPRSRTVPEKIDFHPITADFGTAQQEFHIGMGSIATPGVVKGLFTIHRERCRLPLSRLIEPACEAAREGVTINEFQHYIAEIVSPIIRSSTAALQLHASRERPDTIASPGTKVRQPEMANSFEQLAREGDALFYRGEMAQQLIRDCSERGGYLRADDLANYQVERRQPLAIDYHGHHIYTNPAPSVGGTLIAFALALLEQERLADFTPGSIEHLVRVTEAQRLAQCLRQEQEIELNLTADRSRQILSDRFLHHYRTIMQRHPLCSRGTTQISIADAEGNMASMTLSNGEGSGYVIPGTGIMMNNMLGEEDINPHGFNLWPEDRRIASMMSPTLVAAADGRLIATGSGGSNRIRSAILQVLINLLDFNMDIRSAVEHTRLHFEQGRLNIEDGAADSVIMQLFKLFPQHTRWPGKNLFFGGAHTVMRAIDGTLSGQGDSRRGGVSIIG